MKKEGFISMTLVYTFLVVFLFLMLAILNTYVSKDKFLEAINDQIDMDITKNNGKKDTLLSSILKDNTPSSLEIGNDMSKLSIRLFDISNSNSSNGSGLYYTTNPNITDENSDGTTNRIYFFRGEIERNHLVYAGMCFRIIRTNEDGSIRVRYNGQASTEGCKSQSKIVASASDGRSDASIGRSKWNDLSDSREYEGYVYTTGNPDELVADATNPHSKIKDILDEWYLNNIINHVEGTKTVSYEGGIAQGIFCNDRTYGSKNIIPRFKSDEDHSVYNISNITNEITYKCSLRDSFNVLSSVNGNKLLFYPVGTITAADVAFAGGYMTNESDKYKGGSKGMKNIGYYMYTGEDVWTMSPYGFEGNKAKMVYIDNEGILKATNVDAEHNIVPVISLKATNIVKKGNGTPENPYIVEIGE